MPLRVLLVVDSLDGGGAERHVADLAGALRGRGWPVHVACSADGVLRGRLAAAGVPVHVLGGRLVKRCSDPGYAARLRGLVAALRPDVVHAHVHASEVAAAAALDGDGTPLVLTEHTEAPWRSAPDRQDARRALARADLALAVSTAVRRNILALGGAPERTCVLLPAVVPPCAAASARPGDTARGDSGAPVVGYLGRLAPSKGVPVLLEAFVAVRRALPEARLLLVGDGPERDRLAERAAALGPSVRLLGFREDAPALLSEVDVLAVPSLADGSPLVVAEANAAGVPVVATAVGGLPDRVCPERDGLLVPPGDPAALAGALVRVLTDDDLRRRLADAGRRRALTETHAAMVDRLAALYLGVAGRRPGRAAALQATAVQNL